VFCKYVIFLPSVQHNSVIIVWWYPGKEKFMWVIGEIAILLCTGRFNKWETFFTDVYML